MQLGVEHRVKIAVEAKENRRPSLVVVLDTRGGIVEVGPIDPQLELDDRLVPALSYLSQYESLTRRLSGTS